MGNKLSSSGSLTRSPSLTRSLKRTLSGNTSRRKSSISNLAKVDIPVDYKLIKIASYNVNLRKSITSDSKIKNIISYILNEDNMKEIDILCIQGIHDFNSAFALVLELKKYCKKHKIEMYFVPYFDDMLNASQQSKFSSEVMFDASWNTSNNKNNKKKPDKKESDKKKHHKKKHHKNEQDDNEQDKSEQNESEQDKSGQNSKQNSKQDSKQDSEQNSEQNSKQKSTSNENTSKTNIQNIIISRHPIISTMYSELDKETDMDDLLGVKTVISANIAINNNIISIYNTELCKDILSAGIINNNVRKTEIEEIYNIIRKNIEFLKTNKFSEYKCTDIHFLMGSLNICEYQNNETNNEFVEFIKKYNCFDIYRFLKDDDFGFTTSYMERMDYILLLLTEDLYKKTSPYYKKIKKISNYQDLADIIFKRYDVHFIEYYIKRNNISDTVHNFPIECVYMMKT